MSAYAFFVALHVTAGTVALATFWLSALLRKGSTAHIWVGRTYLLSMCGVIVSALPMVAQRIADGRWVAAVFLGYLVVLVATTVWLAWRAIRDKAAPARYLGLVYRALIERVLAHAASSLAAQTSPPVSQPSPVPRLNTWSVSSTVPAGIESSVASFS